MNSIATIVDRVAMGMVLASSIVPAIPAWASGNSGEVVSAMDDGRVRINDRTRYYPVTADSLDDLIRRFSDPKSRAGVDDPELSSERNEAAIYALTTSVLTVDWSFRRGEKRCELERYFLTLDVQMTFPEWKPTHAAEHGFEREWEKMLGYIRSHELRHRENVLDAVHAIDSALSAIGEADSCGHLRARMNRAINVAWARRALRDRELDDTNLAFSERVAGHCPDLHGATFGKWASFNEETCRATHVVVPDGKEPAPAASTAGEH